MADKGSPLIEMGIFKDRGEVVELKVSSEGISMRSQGDHDQQHRHNKGAE